MVSPNLRWKVAARPKVNRWPRCIEVSLGNLANLCLHNFALQTHADWIMSANNVLSHVPSASLLPLLLKITYKSTGFYTFPRRIHFRITACLRNICIYCIPLYSFWLIEPLFQVMFKCCKQMLLKQNIWFPTLLNILTHISSLPLFYFCFFPLNPARHG